MEELPTVWLEVAALACGGKEGNPATGAQRRKAGERKTQAGSGGGGHIFHHSANIPVQICQASVFHSPGISAKLFSKKGRKMAAILASLLAIASLAAAKPQVFFVTIFSA